MKEDTKINDAVSLIKNAILQSQARAVSLVNQEQLTLYFGIGKYVSINTRNGVWGRGAIKNISDKLKSELPGLRGFGETNLKNMRTFYESWKELESATDENTEFLVQKSSVQTDGFHSSMSVASDVLTQTSNNKQNTIRQLQLTNLPGFPIVEFLSISFTHHVTIFTYAKDFDERLFYIRYTHNNKPSVEYLEQIIRKQDLFHHQGVIPNNFLSSIPDYKQAFRAIQMFKDEYLLDFINVEELGVRDEEVDERVIENGIVHNVKNFIMTFGKGFAFIGNQVHFDKLGHDHWVDLLFYNRDLERTVVFELKAGAFKVAYLAQLSSYLRILNDDDRRANEKAPIGIILCKDVDKAYVEYIMQDFKQPMGVATYKTAEDMDPEVLKVLPPKEELQKLLQSNDKG
ncbi:MAG: PDDEXK nuclease domain-containing protein [Bacteroidales bacterium]|nr:PDDEXK nuclease domain-containing protein [Bacteroidales bacterium]